jgi:outer membrane protein assembly factor BamB
MVGSLDITALAGVDLSTTQVVLIAAGGIALAVGAFFAARWAWPHVRGWSRGRQIAAGAASVLVVAAGAYALYTALDRPDDVLNEDVPFKAEKNEKKSTIKAVSWPMYGYDRARTRYLPSKRVNPPFGSSLWSFQAGKLLEFSPVVAGGKLYLTDKDALVRQMDVGTGRVHWKRKVGELNASSPAFADGRLFAVTLEPGDIQALRAKDGKVLWERALPGRSESSPVVYRDKVIVGTEPGTLYALDVRTGKVRWSVDTGGAVKGGASLNNGIAFFGNYAGELWAVDAANGKVKWQTSTQSGSFGRSDRIYSTPAIAFGRVYVGGIANRVYSFNEENGDLAWSKSTGDFVYAGPAVAEVPGAPPTVYIGSVDQNFYALDAKTGSTRWRKHVGGPILGAASIIGRVAYVGVIGPNNGTFGFDADSGKKVFEHELGEYNPVISDGKRLILTGSSALRVFPPHVDKKKKGRQGKGGAEKASEKPADGAGEAE